MYGNPLFEQADGTQFASQPAVVGHGRGNWWQVVKEENAPNGFVTTNGFEANLIKTNNTIDEIILIHRDGGSFTGDYGSPLVFGDSQRFFPNENIASSGIAFEPPSTLSDGNDWHPCWERMIQCGHLCYRVMLREQNHWFLKNLICLAIHLVKVVMKLVLFSFINHEAHRFNFFARIKRMFSSNYI